jgi:hypothetical protein
MKIGKVGCGGSSSTSQTQLLSLTLLGNNRFITRMELSKTKKFTRFRTPTHTRYVEHL